MRRYMITLVLVAVSIGALFQGADKTGVRLLKMAGTIGILLFGVIGTMMITRWQSRQGLKETETALKSLEPECLITDWAYQGGERPDYLVVAPSGLVAVCLNETPRTASDKRTAVGLAEGAKRLQRAAQWIRGRLDTVTGEAARALPVETVLVLTRRKANETFTVDGITVCNPDQLSATIKAMTEEPHLDQATRVNLTRVLRSEPA